MQAAFKIWETNRNIYARILNEYSLEQLNTTPPGFTNNLVWNLGHIIVAQQGLIYRLSGLPMHVSDEMYERYRNGTKPTEASQEEVDELKSLLFSLIQTTKDDYAAGKFKAFSEYTTQMGFYIGSLEESIVFNNYHEGMHLGFMLNIRKFL